MQQGCLLQCISNQVGKFTLARTLSGISGYRTSDSALACRWAVCSTLGHAAGQVVVHSLNKLGMFRKNLIALWKCYVTLEQVMSPFVMENGLLRHERRLRRFSGNVLDRPLWATKWCTVAVIKNCNNQVILKGRGIVHVLVEGQTKVVDVYAIVVDASTVWV